MGFVVVSESWVKAVHARLGGVGVGGTHRGRKSRGWRVQLEAKPTPKGGQRVERPLAKGRDAGIESPAGKAGAIETP
jgi:hypothetical protein